MQALILKDFRLLKFINIAQVIVGGIFTIVGVNVASFFLSQLVFVFLIFILTYVASMIISVHESKTQGDVIINSLPVKKSEIVKARYLAMLLYSLLVGIFIFTLSSVSDVFMGDVNPASIFSIIFGISLNLLFLTFYLPFQYYSIGKVQIFNAFFYMFLIIIPTIFNRYREIIMGTDFLQYLLTLNFSQISLMSFGLSLLIYLFSFTVARTIYKNKEF